jgi:ketosteroid isomerase-like protein
VSNAVSAQNVELTRRLLDVWSSRDIDALIAGCDPEVEWHSTFAAVGGAVYHGHDGLRSYQRDMEDAWGGDIRLEPELFFDLGGELTLSFHVVHARGKHSGVEVEMPIAGVFRWRDGLMIYFKGFADRAQALAELGVSEDDLDGIAP